MFLRYNVLIKSYDQTSQHDKLVDLMQELIAEELILAIGRMK